MIAASEIRYQRWHNATEVIGDPVWFRIFQPSLPCWRSVVETVTNRLRQITPLADWTPWLILC